MPQLPFSVQYVAIDEFIDGIMVRGKGTLMTKFVVTTTYHNNAVHLDDRYLFVTKWKGANTLPFGLHSMPFIFTSVADMVKWTLTHNHGVEFLCHYLDDFSYWDPLRLMFA